LLLLIFWFTNGHIDAASYSIVSFYIVLPIAIFITSFKIAKYVTKKGLKIFFIILFGLFYMASEFLTFSLLNMMTFHKFNIPELYMILIGAFISFIGFILGDKYGK
jgi:hypothetical protein